MRIGKKSSSFVEVIYGDNENDRLFLNVRSILFIRPRIESIDIMVDDGSQKPFTLKSSKEKMLKFYEEFTEVLASLPERENELGRRTRRIKLPDEE